tara:strand:- start:3277 stop:3609 length:333 start_codon:yes stop_codon:yes gene_type:complete
MHEDQAPSPRSTLFDGIDVSKLPPPRNEPVKARDMRHWYTDRPVTWADGQIWTNYNDPIPFVRPEMQNERLALCNNCDSYDKVNFLCLKCHCLMKTKSKFYDSKCPIGKW